MFYDILNAKKSGAYLLTTRVKEVLEFDYILML